VWVPYVPPLLALIGTGGGIVIYRVIMDSPKIASQGKTPLIK
jgi:hypothetical protein